MTEAAENLKKRAVVSVRMGRENEAVELLVQKKKLTNALENIKERIELLDKLSAKISELWRPLSKRRDRDVIDNIITGLRSSASALAPPPPPPPPEPD